MSYAVPSDRREAGVYPRYVDLDGVRNYLISVRALPPDVSAGKLGEGVARDCHSP